MVQNTHPNPPMSEDRRWVDPRASTACCRSCAAVALLLTALGCACAAPATGTRSSREVVIGLRRQRARRTLAFPSMTYESVTALRSARRRASARCGCGCRPRGAGALAITVYDSTVLETPGEALRHRDPRAGQGGRLRRQGRPLDRRGAGRHEAASRAWSGWACARAGRADGVGQRRRLRPGVHPQQRSAATPWACSHEAHAHGPPRARALAPRRPGVLPPDGLAQTPRAIALDAQRMRAASQAVARSMPRSAVAPTPARRRSRSTARSPCRATLAARDARAGEPVLAARRSSSVSVTVSSGLAQVAALDQHGAAIPGARSAAAAAARRPASVDAAARSAPRPRARLGSPAWRGRRAASSSAERPVPQRAARSRPPAPGRIRPALRSRRARARAPPPPPARAPCRSSPRPAPARGARCRTACSTASALRASTECTLPAPCSVQAVPNQPRHDAQVGCCKQISPKPRCTARVDATDGDDQESRRLSRGR